MKIESVDIYGFGKWVDQSFDFSDQSVICLYGENEAGKSTLQQFILYMLFGLPPKVRNFYKPKHSNRIGGMMKLNDPEIGIYTIERVEGEVQCFLPTGEKKDETWLNHQLEGLTREVYTSIYSFSATDLSAIRQMQSAELSDVLFSVGLTGATTIYEMEKQLDKQIGDLFKKSGRIPIINEQLKKVSEMKKRVEEDKRTELSYREKILQREALVEDISTVEQKLRSLKVTLLELEKKKQVMPILKQYELIEQELHSFEEDIPFPQDGLQRYETLKLKLLPLKSESQIIQQNMAEQDAKIKQLTENISKDDKILAAKKLLKKYPNMQISMEKLRDVEKNVAQVEQTLQDLLQTTNFLEKEIDEIVFPFHVEKNWKTLSETSEALQQESEILADEQMVLSEEINRLQKEAKAIKNQFLSQEQIQFAKEQIKDFHQQQERKHWDAFHTRSKKVNQGVLLLSSILALIASAVALFSDQYMLFAVPAILLVFVIGQFYVSKIATNSMKIEENHMNISKEEFEKLEQQLAKQEQLETSLQVIENEIKRLELQQVQWNERKKIFIKKENKWLHAIDIEKETYPFLQNVEPAYWLELFHTIKEMQDLLEEKHHLMERKETIHHEIESFKIQVANFVADENKEAHLAIEQIESMLEEHRSAIQLLEQYRTMQAENRAKLTELISEIAIYETEIAQLFNMAQVENEEEYFQRANTLKMKKELLQQKENIIQQVLVSISENELSTILNEKFSENDIEISILDVSDTMKELENELESKNKQLATITLEIEQLETAEAISHRAYLFEIEKDKLNQLAKQWASLKIAQEALKRAKKTYQEKHLESVIHYTTIYFNQLTNGRYVNVFAPTETQLFRVDASNDIRYTVDELSQGTIDQLYVSLRLAIGKVMSEKNLVPFIIDDAFVHFDDARTKEMITLLKRIASENNQQIFIFTCKQSIAKEFNFTAMGHFIESR